MDHFEKKGWSDSDELSSGGESDSSSEEENFDGENSEEELDVKSLWKKDFSPFQQHERYKALYARDALRIYQGLFQEVDDLDLSDSGLKALQSQLHNPTLPNDFILRVGKKSFPHIFKPHPNWKDNLERGCYGAGTVMSITESADKYGWFFDAAIERGHLDPILFKEIVDLSISLGAQEDGLFGFEGVDKTTDSEDSDGEKEKETEENI